MIVDLGGGMLDCEAGRVPKSEKIQRQWSFDRWNSQKYSQIATEEHAKTDRRNSFRAKTRAINVWSLLARSFCSIEFFGQCKLPFEACGPNARPKGLPGPGRFRRRRPEASRQWT